MTRVITVTSGRRESECPIWVGRGLIRSLPELLSTPSYSSLAIVADRGAEHVLFAAREALGVSQDATLVIEGGETCKTIAHVEHMWRFFSERKLDRKSLIFAIGGGAVSDLVGFACATYMRGVACVTVPTTLLAQVDAAIGGKTGVNFAGVKNLIGSVRQPAGIVVDIDTLSGLALRQVRSGFAEIVKHGLIADAPYFDRVTSMSFDLWSPDEMVDIVHTSCALKASVVGQDETEEGARKTLNFGHTLGHAIEAVSMNTPSPLTHGEAVAIGMRAACHISNRLGLLSNRDVETIVAGFRRTGLPTRLESPLHAELLLAAMSLDKKSVAGKTRWTLLQGIGSAIVDQDVPVEMIKKAIASIQPG